MQPAEEASVRKSVDGAFCVQKPKDLTSSNVVAALKKALTRNGYAERGFKIGHGGTLDPFATGVLVILCGEATKLADSYLHSRKKYSSTVKLGVQTDSADLTGTVTNEAPVPKLSPGDWQAFADQFVNKPYLQTPPMHSAKKVEGRPLYEMAHRGESIEREAILKRIYNLEVYTLLSDELSMTVDCESGTYVRVLAEDLAKKAGTLAHLSRLERIQSSDVRITDCMPLDALIELLDSSQPLQEISGFKPLHQVASHLPFIEISEEEATSTRQGISRITHLLCTRAAQDHPQSSYVLAKIRHSLANPVALFEKQANPMGFRLQRVFNSISP